MVESLRERQKERRQHHIMDAASQLIGEQGFDVTTIQEIAARAEVGVATVYNYFGSKSDLLLALFVQYIEHEAELGESVLKSPPDDMEEGVVALFGAYLDGMAARTNPRLLQEFLVLSVSKQLDYGQETYNLKLRFVEQCHALAAHYKRLGRLRDDVDVDEAATVYYSAAMLPIALFSLGRVSDRAVVMDMLRRQVHLIITGLGRQNEGRPGIADEGGRIVERTGETRGNATQQGADHRAGARVEDIPYGRHGGAGARRHEPRGVAR